MASYNYYNREAYSMTPPLRRNTPSLPVLSGPYGFNRFEMANTRVSYFEDPLQSSRSITPQMDTRPLAFTSARPVPRRASTQKERPVTLGSDGARRAYGDRLRTEHVTDRNAASTKSRHPPTPKRKSSYGATLRRRSTVDGRKTRGTVMQVDGSVEDPDKRPSPRDSLRAKKSSNAANSLERKSSTTADIIERKTSSNTAGIIEKKKSSLERTKSSIGKRSGMAWLQRPEKKEIKSKINNRPQISVPIITIDGEKPEERAFTDPITPRNEALAARRVSVDLKRAVSSASRFRKAFSMGSDSASNDEESLENDENKMKKWKKRVFSKDFFKPETKTQKDRIRAPHMPSVAPSVVSDISEKTVITHRSSFDSVASTNTAASQAASTEWQIDGVGAQEDPTKKAFNDSIIAIIDGKVGSKAKPKCGKQWRPPILTLDMQVISSVDRVPVKVDRGYEFWVAVVLQGIVQGDIDIPGTPGNAAGIGLDVGVLLDISCYTSPESFEEMKYEAKRLVETMETSRDRIAVMTFSSPPTGKRKPIRGKANLRVLNSSGSVAKKQLIDNISSLQPALNAGPSGRDVNAAVAAAIKTLHNMPMDTSKYGSKRSGHLFLITSKLGDSVIRGDFGGVKVHVLGVGPAFNPTSLMGAEGFCTAMASPLEPGHRLKKIVSDGIEIPVDKPPGSADVKTIINLLRMGVNLGVIEDGDLFLYPGDGCKLKSTVGSTKFPKLLPGEHKSLMVKIEVEDLPGWDSDEMDFEGAERQLQATIGQLSSTILTVEAVYHHSHMGTPETIITTKGCVDVTRYVEGVWSRSAQDLSEDMPAYYAEERHKSDKALVGAVLVQMLISQVPCARDARDAVEKLENIEAPTVLRELGYQVYLEDRFGTQVIAEDPSLESYSDPMMEVFERRFSHDSSLSEDSPKSREYDGQSSGSAPLMDNSWAYMDQESDLGARSDSECIGSSIRARKLSKSLEVHRQSPDEAKRLWIRLGSGYVEDQVGGLREDNINSVEDIDDRDVFYGRGKKEQRKRRNSAGQETMITLRDVRETAFSPWAV